MQIVKRFNDEAFESLQRGVIRIGFLAYYRKIETSERLDVTEGPIGVLIHAQDEAVELSGEQLNRVNKEVGARYRISRNAMVTLQKGASLKIDSDVNVFVFCTSIDALEDEALSHKLGQNVVEVVDMAGFSKLITGCLHQKVIVEKYLDLKGNADRIGGAYEPVTYREKVSRALHELKGGGVDLSGIFVKPMRYEEEQEFRFAWIPLCSNNENGCDLPTGFEYVDLEIPVVWKYLKCV